MSTNEDSNPDEQDEYPVQPSVIALAGILVLVVASFFGAAVYISDDYNVGGDSLEAGYEYPNGTSDETIEDTEELVLSHQDTLNSTSYSLSSQSDSVRGQTETTTNVSYLYDGEQATFSETRKADGRISQETQRQIHLNYQTERGYQQTVSEENTTYSTQQVQTEQPYVGGRTISSQVGSLDWTFVNTTTQQGVETAVYEVDGVSEDANLDASNFTASGEIYVSESGVIRKFRVNVESSGQQPTSVSSEQVVTVDEVGETTVQSPDWIEAAIESSQSTNTTE